MKNYSPVYRRCACTDPTTGRRYGANCPRLADDPGHGSWYFSIRLGHHRVRRGGFRTAQAAEQARQDLVGQAPEPASDAGLTVAAWLDAWVASLPKRRVRWADPLTVRRQPSIERQTGASRLW